MLASSMKTCTSLFLLLALTCVPLVAEETIYRCGNTYSNNPCKNARKLQRSVSRYTQPEYPKLLEEARARMAADAAPQVQESRSGRTSSTKKKNSEEDTAKVPAGEQNLAIRGAGLSNEELRNLAGIRAPSSDDTQSSD